jgi:hypothetical protein
MKKIFSITVVVIAMFLAVFIGKLYEVAPSATAVAALNPSNQSVPLTGGSLTKALPIRIPLTTGSDIVPLSGQSNMLQFTAGGHILGFQPNKAYLASLDHALSVEFLNTKGAMPTSTTDATVQSAGNTLAKAPTLTAVLYNNLWEGINLTYASTKEGITESTYTIAPHADVSQIKLKYNVPVSRENDGSLRFAFETGCLTESKPIAWQDINGKRVPVTVAFNVRDNEIGFSLGAYNPHEPLIIDPTYVWHTFYGAADNNNFGNAIAVDTSGNIYVMGYSNISWGSPLHAHSGGTDLFVLKLNSNGARQWHTFYGSGDDDYAYAIAIDTSSNVYVTGSSETSWAGDRPSMPIAVPPKISSS